MEAGAPGEVLEMASDLNALLPQPETDCTFTLPETNEVE